MSNHTCRRLAPLAAITVTAAVAGIGPASAGLIDGSLNNLHLADRADILTAMLNSNVVSDANNNRNVTRMRPLPLVDRDTTGDRCEATLTATDPDGAAGTAAFQVAATAEAHTELRITDQVPGTVWHRGDVDHFAGQLVCYDARTGAVIGMVAIDEDLTAA
jgi:hypothetical protein